MGQALAKLYYQPQVCFAVWLGRQYLLDMWAKIQTKWSCSRQNPSTPSTSRPPSPNYATLPPMSSSPLNCKGGLDCIPSDAHVYDCPHHGGHQPLVCQHCVEEEVELRVSEDEGGGGGGGVEEEEATRSAHLRPPSFNPEDYAQALAKYSRTPHVYLEPTPKEKKGRGERGRGGSGGEVRGEMTLRQFSSLPELLRRLRDDLKTAYLSFVKELVREPHDGVSLLLDVLKSVQLSQTDLNGRGTSQAQQMALRRALADEHEVLSCLRYCLRSSDAAVRVARYPPGLYILAVATLSNLPRSRTLALELLTRACMAPGGRGRVVEALATLRLRFAEPVTCKFLVAMMLSYPHPSLQVWGLRLINCLVVSSESIREKVYLQEELTLAGLHPPALRKVIERAEGEGGWKDAALKELIVWETNYVDVSSLHGEVEGLRMANSTLQDELAKLRQANMKLLEENVLLKTVGGEVEERCAALQRRLNHSGLPLPPSPALSFTDSDLSSLATVRSRNLRPHSPSQNCDTETDSVIFQPIRSLDDVSSDDTVVPSRPPSASSSSLLITFAPPIPPHAPRSRHHSSPSSTLDFVVTTPLATSCPTPGETRGLEGRGGEMRKGKNGGSEARSIEMKEGEGIMKETKGSEYNNNNRGIETKTSEIRETRPRTNESKTSKTKGREVRNIEIRENETNNIEIRVNDIRGSEIIETEIRGSESRSREVRSRSEDKFNESRPPHLIDMTLHNEAKSPHHHHHPSRPSRGSSGRQRQQVSEQPPTFTPSPSSVSPSALTPPSVSPLPGEKIKVGETHREAEKSSPPPSSYGKSPSPLSSSFLPSSSSSRGQNPFPCSSSCPVSSSPNSLPPIASPGNKRKAPHPSVASPLSSSTSSLSSSSSTPSSPGAGQQMDPEYMNIPRRAETRDNETKKGMTRNGEVRGNSDTRGSNETDVEMDYERDLGVYEAVTVAGDRIFIQSTGTQGSGSSSSTQTSRGSQEKGSGWQEKIRRSPESRENQQESRAGSQESRGHQEKSSVRQENNRSPDNRESQQDCKGNQETSNSGQESSVMESVRHYENLAMMADQAKTEIKIETKTEARTEAKNEIRSPRNGDSSWTNEGKERREEQGRRRGDGKRGEGSERKGEGIERKGEERAIRKMEERGMWKIEGSNDDVTEGEVEAVMIGLENVLRSAESSLSLTSQETIRETSGIRDHFEDRSSPGAAAGEELEIVPTRVPHPPARPHSHTPPTSTPSDPVLFLEMESPAETSDTETLRQPRPGSPNTMETESTQSFGFVKPDTSLRRRETITESGGGGGERRRPVRRCESFQAGGSECEYEYDSHRSYSPRRRTTADPHVAMREKAVHISGRVFTRYTPKDVERRNHVNNLITAELAKRKNISVEDRLDQWHGTEEDWTLRWRYPDVHPDSKSRPTRTRSRTRSPPRREPPRRSRSSSRHPSHPTPIQAPHKPNRAPKFSSSELIAFTGFRNPNGGGFRESDYGPNFMLNTPSQRHQEFTEYGGRDFPPPLPPHRTSRERGGGRRKADFDPDIPTPDYTATPAGTLTAPSNGPPIKHILDMPSGLY